MEFYGKLIMTICMGEEMAKRLVRMEREDGVMVDMSLP